MESMATTFGQGTGCSLIRLDSQGKLTSNLISQYASCLRILSSQVHFAKVVTMTFRMCKASLPKRSITGNEFSWTTISSLQIRPGLLFNRSYSRLSSTSNPEVRIVEHGPRYGLQGIKKEVPTATKLQLIQRLAQAGLRDIEATTFGPQEFTTQFADGTKIMNEMFQFQKQHQMRGLALPVSVAPNLGTLEKVRNAGVKEIMVSASASEEFSRASQNCTVEQSLARIEEVVKQAVGQGLRVRG